MDKPLHILMLEDNPEDAELVEFELQEAGFNYISEKVMTEKDFLRGIEEFQPDIILSDYELPTYSGARALAAARAKCPDVPFILVTGAISEELAIDTLTSGAKDYVMKTRLHRLAPAVNRALAEAAEHRARKAAEAALKESEKNVRLQLEEIQTIYDSAPIGMCFLDKNLRYVRINRRLAEMNGRPATEHIGRTVQEVIPEMAPFVERIAALIFKTGKPVLNYEITGTEINQKVQKQWLSNWVPLKDAENNVIGINVATEDITEIKKAEDHLRQSHIELESMIRERTADLESKIEDLRRTQKALKESEERLRLTLEASGVGTFEVDLTTGEGRWNAIEYELLGLKPGEVPPGPETFFRYVHPEDVTQLRAQWEEATRTGIFNAEFRVIRADRQERWLAGKGQFLFAETADAEKERGRRSPLRFLGVNFDVTERKQAEAAVTAAHSQIQSIIDNALAIVYAFDLEERFLMVNSAVAKLFNTTPERMIGKRRHEFMPKKDADWHEANDRQVIEEGRALEFEEYSRLKDRSITWLTTKFPLHDAQGRIYAVAGISTDITERKQAEEKLRESEERFRVLNETSPVGVGVSSTEGLLLYTNPAYELILGYSRGELLGRKASDLYLNPDDRTSWLAAMKDGHAVRNAEIRLKRKDGSPVWVSINTSDICYGGRQAVMGTIQDITDRKQAEEQLLSTLESVGDGFFAVDAEWRFVYVNAPAERILGIRREEVLGKSHWDIFPQTLGTELEKRYHMAADGQAQDWENFYEPWGRWFHNRCFPRKNGGMAVYFREITDRKQLEAALRESEERYRALLNSMTEDVSRRQGR